MRSRHRQDWLGDFLDDALSGLMRCVGAILFIALSPVLIVGWVVEKLFAKFYLK